jgi:uncharacterized membrane protein (DUF373 family)
MNLNPFHFETNGAKIHPMKYLFRGMNFVVSLFVLGLTLVLLYYMIARLGLMMHQVLKDEFLSPNNSESLLSQLAYAIVLIKAYTILRSYLKTHRLNLKFLIEIAIIACVIEVIFNWQAHSMAMNAVFGLFGLANLLLYLVYYDRLALISKDYQKNKKRSFFNSYDD